MRILHTADLHLARHDEPRWRSFEQLLACADEEACDFLVISGDLFDSAVDAEALRVTLRSFFDDADSEALIIPGNHDEEALRTGLHFGQGVRVLNDPDWTKNIVDREDVRLIGIPYQEMKADEFHRRLRSLQDAVDPDCTNILLYHGELLDVSFDRKYFGPEDGRYMPSRLAYFAELGVDYVLAGHFHSNFQVCEFGEGGFFVYPGSPVSITRREVGQRSVALIEPDKATRQILLDTHHYVRVRVTLDASSDDDPIEVVRESLRDVHPDATVLLTVDGTVRDVQEQELRRAILEATADTRVEDIAWEFRDLSHILGHPVYGMFVDRLESMQASAEDPLSPEGGRKLREMLIRAMTRVRL